MAGDHAGSPLRNEGSGGRTAPRTRLSALATPATPTAGSGEFLRLGVVVGRGSGGSLLAAAGMGAEAAVEFGNLVGGQALQIILAVAVVAGGGGEAGAAGSEGGGPSPQVCPGW